MRFQILGSNNLMRAILFMSFLTLIFQNCAKHPKYPIELATTNKLDDVIKYPSLTPVILKTNQTISLKIQKPVEMTKASDWYWYAGQDGQALVTNQGAIVDSGPSVLVTLSVQKKITGTKQFKLVFVNKLNSSQKADGKGVPVKIDPYTTTSNLKDYQTELCKDSYFQKTSATFDKTNSTNPLFFVDKGGGVASTSCSFYLSDKWQTVDCFNPSSWPSNWQSLQMYVAVVDRCLGINSLYFKP